MNTSSYSSEVLDDTLSVTDVRISREQAHQEIVNRYLDCGVEPDEDMLDSLSKEDLLEILFNVRQYMQALDIPTILSKHIEIVEQEPSYLNELMSLWAKFKR
jgi:hypothetical protein